MKFRISWTDIIGRYTIIEANSADEAENAFDEGRYGDIKEDGFSEMEQDSIEIREEK